MTPADLLAEQLEQMATDLRAGRYKPWMVGWLVEQLRPVLRVVYQTGAAVQPVVGAANPRGQKGAA